MGADKLHMQEPGSDPEVSSAVGVTTPPEGVGQAVQSALEAGEARFRIAYEEAAVGMVMLDLQGIILEVNRAICEISSYSAEDLVGQPMTVLLGAEQAPDVARALGDIKNGVRSYRIERRLVRRDGASLWVRNSVTVLDYDGKPARLFVLVEDITEGKLATEKLQYQAAHEEVTGLFNRRHFEALLDKAIQTAVQTDGRAALLYLDLDGFKLVNDTLGHAKGDDLLQAVGKALAESVGSAEGLARLGGDEFALLRADCGPDEAAALATKMLNVFQQSFKIGSHELRISASVGVATSPTDGKSAGVLLQNADAAMYSAKRQGRNRYATFTSDLRAHALERLEMETQIRSALRAGEFHAEYQPVLDAKEKKLTRFEAVCRWHNARLGNVSPMKFIPVAEEIGIMVELGQFMLREACLAAASWTVAGTPAGVAVNISAMEFALPDFVETVWKTVQETRVNPTLVELELTEGVLTGDIEVCIDKITRLRDLGVRVTLDDFGTGQSSLSHLRRIPVAALKIDRTFVAGLQYGPSAVSLVRSIIGIATSFGLRVLADGVENEAQFRVLRFLGCNEVQGFLFGRPETLEAATGRLREEQSRLKAARLSEWGGTGRSGSALQRRLG